MITKEEISNLEVSASTLAFLLNSRKGQTMRVEQVEGMIESISEANGRHKDTVTVKDFEKAYSHYPILDAIHSIKNSYTKKGTTTRVYIMNLPLSRIEKEGEIKSYYRIPSNIRALLEEDQISEIIEEWRVRYSGFDTEFKR
jgi:capsule polysaccharide export protein KpsE/RkpR